MKRIRLRAGAAVATVAVLGMLAPIGAHAENNCASNVVIFSDMTTPAGEQNTPNNNALWCVADANPDPDTRLINPGSDAVSVRLVQDLGASVPTLTAILNGLGFDHKQVQMTRSTGSLGASYDSSVIALPSGATSSGCISATLYDVVSDPDMLEPIDSNTFHTIDHEATAC